MTPATRCFLRKLGGALLLILVFGGSAPASAQVVAEPGTIEVAVAPGGTAEVPLMLTNAGGGALTLVVAPQPAETGEGTPGETLFTRAFEGVDTPYDLTMTLDGRIFVAAHRYEQTWEYAPDLTLVRSFEHPHLDFFSSTPGIAWMPPEHTPDPAAFSDGSLWWLDVLTDSDDGTVYLEHAILIEGDLDGVPTGRQIEIPVGPAAPPWTSGIPTGLSYDPEAAGGAGLFYYVDVINNDVWAVSVDGTVAEGYPVPQSDYDTGEPFVMKGRTVDAVRVEDGDAAGEYLELPIGVEPENRMMRVALTDRWGQSLGPEAPLASLTPPDGFGRVLRVSGALRSRVDSSIMYLTVLTGEPGIVREWLFAVRAVPLPPRWLRVEPVFVDVGGGASETVTVQLDAADLAEGVYEAALKVQRRDGSGETLAEVPVVLTVGTGTAADDPPGENGVSWLSVYPNPARSGATVHLTLGTAAEVRVVVYDVLGREVAVLHEGALSAGEHTFRFEAAGLPSGVYLVRAETERAYLSERITRLR